MKKFEYIKEASPFGSLRQIPESENPEESGKSFSYHGAFVAAQDAYVRELLRMPLYPLSTQPSNEWMQRKEYEEGVDFKKGYFVKTDSYQGEGGGYFDTYEEAQEKYFEWSKYDGHLQSFAYPPKEVAIPIEKKDDLVASQNHPQPESSVATLACTEGNSIRQKFEELFKFKSEEEETKHNAYMLMAGYLSEIERFLDGDKIKRNALAKKIGTSPSYITQVFRGDKPLNFFTLAKIKKALNIRFEVTALPMPIQEVQECDARKAEQSNEAGSQNPPIK